MKTNRRNFMQRVGLGAAGMGIVSPLALSATTNPTPTQNDEQVLFVGENIAVTDTQYGKVRGFILRGIYQFLGIPYGADTSGANRFMPPQKPKAWTDTFPALWWGNSAPQDMENRYANKYFAFRDQWNYDDVSEDCLRIHVFTPGYKDGKKRPVLVWMHGGGWTNGNAIEHSGYHGENLARLGDIVFCSINHRLGPMGYADLSAVGGEKYAASGNVGALDLIAALEWVRDNIANFGGDPANVTIMGQSGGGAKVCTTTAMPSSQGLVNKAVVLSGARLKLTEKSISSQIGAYILQEAGLKASEIDKLQTMPWQEYYKIAVRASDKLAKDTGNNAISRGRIFQPHVDGKYIPQHPYHPEASPYAANIPMIICSTTNESSPSWYNPSLESISLQEVKSKISEEYSAENAEKMVNAYAKAFPDKKPIEIWTMLTTHRQRTVLLADAKSRQSAPVYTAWFGWQPPLFDNRLRSFHCLDICFWFYNTDLMLSHTGGGARPRALSQKMAGALLQFMKTGNPNGGGLPEWLKYTAEKKEVMFLDDVCKLQSDPDGEARNTFPPYEGY